MFNGALLSSFYFLTLYLQGVSGYTPREAGVAFLPQTLMAFAVASAVPALTRRLGGPLVAVIGTAAMVVSTAWLSRLGTHTAYLTGIALPMLFYGAAQGLSLSSLTTASMAGVAHEDAGVAGGSSTSPTTSVARSGSASSPPCSPRPAPPAPARVSCSPTASTSPSPAASCSPRSRSP